MHVSRSAATSVIVPKCINMSPACAQNVFLLLCVYCVSSSAFDPNSEGTNCVNFTSSDYNYGHFFKISDLKSEYGTDISLKFRVKAPSDAHIMFSERPFPQEDEPAYEVVIGAGKNTFSFIRRKVTDMSKIRLETLDFLSADEARGFWIQIDEGGRIDVGKKGEYRSLMSWEDDQPLDIKYFSFSSWKNVTAEWFYNCDELEDDEEEDILTFLGVNVMLQSRGPPIDNDISKHTNILTHLSLHNINLDDRRSVFTVDGTLYLLWEDRRIIWSPEKYRNKTYLDWNPHDPWTPNVMLRNAVENPSGGHRRYAFQMRMHSNGTVHWKYPVHFSAFCKGIDYNHWPKDSHVCELQLELKPPHTSIKMVPSKGGVQLQDSMTSSGWIVTNFNATTQWISSLESTHKELDSLMPPKSGHVIFQFNLTRSHDTHSSVPMISMAAISILILSSFWASPLGLLKLSLQCISLVMTTLCLLFCWKTFPGHQTLPAILSALIMIMHMTWVAIVSTVITSSSIFLAPARVHLSIISFLKSKFLTIFLCLPQPSTKVSACYKQLNGPNSISKEDSHGNSFTSTESDIEWNWILISVVMDRIFFFVYSALFSYLFSTCIN